MLLIICWHFAVKAAGRDFTYLIVVLVGLGVTGDPHFYFLFFRFLKSHIHTHGLIDRWTLLQSALSCVCVCVFPPGGLLYVVFQELFSSSSPNKIYGKAFHKVKFDPEVRMRLQLNKVKHFLFLLSMDTTSLLSYRDHASHAGWMLTLKKLYH